MIKIIFLGTNGWYSTQTGDTVSTLIDARDCYIILDAGNGIRNVDKYIDKYKPVYLFLSHLHIDHIVGLHTLNKFSFPKALTVCCYYKDRQSLEKIFAQPFTIAPKDLPYKTDLFDLREGLFDGVFPFKVLVKKMIHSSSCLGFRFELEGKVISYCTDTGICDGFYDLAKNADLLITECSLKPGQKNTTWPHLNPQDAAKVAKDTNAKRLALTHFDSFEYQNMKDRNNAIKVAKEIFDNVLTISDGAEVCI